MTPGTRCLEYNETAAPPHIRWRRHGSPKWHIFQLFGDKEKIQCEMYVDGRQGAYKWGGEGRKLEGGKGDVGAKGRRQTLPSLPGFPIPAPLTPPLPVSPLPSPIPFPTCVPHCQMDRKANHSSNVVD